ncbi:TPA: aminotransferase class III-fold pyridoxal phosphate-dependent enzyme, partial [Streptococcus suis]
LESVKDLVGPQTAAIMLELVQGEGGVTPADKDFIGQLAALCQTAGILLIVDEVQTGIGRTGSLFAFEQYEIEPDIITLAKGLANGLPVGAMLGKSSLGSAFSYGSHGTTFGGNKLALSSSKQVLEIMTPDFLQQVQDKADYLQEQLKEKLGSLPAVLDIRGLGMMVGIETDADLGQIVVAARQNGLIVLTAGSNVIRLLPPLTITRVEIDQAVAVLEKVMAGQH